MVNISGKIIDEMTLVGIEQTPIYISGKLVAVTDESGNYNFQINPGEYRLEIRPREFLYLFRDVKVTSDGRMMDVRTGKQIKKEMRMVRATL